MRPKSAAPGAAVPPASPESTTVEPIAAAPRPANRAPSDEVRRREVLADLRRRGVAAGFASAICDRLAPFSQDLTPELYDAVLSGVAMAYGVQRRDAESLEDARPDLAEVERLMAGFLAELRKLDENFETLSAYVSRLRRETTGEEGTVH